MYFATMFPPAAKRRHWVKVKVHITLLPDMTAHRGSRGIAILFLQPRR